MAPWHTVYLLAIVSKQILITTGITSRPTRSLGILIDLILLSVFKHHVVNVGHGMPTWSGREIKYYTNLQKSTEKNVFEFEIDCRMRT